MIGTYRRIGEAPVKRWSWAWIMGVPLVTAVHADVIRQERYRYPDSPVQFVVGERTWLLGEEDTARRVPSGSMPFPLAIRVGGEPRSRPMEASERAGQGGLEQATGEDAREVPRCPESSPHVTGVFLEESP
jgi:hypothetical protein